MLESMSNLLYSSIYNVLCLYSIHVTPTTLYAATIYYSTKTFKIIQCNCYTVNLEIFMYPFFGLLNFRRI